MNDYNINITDSNKFEEIIQSLEDSHNKIKTLFLNEKNNQEKINSTDIWTSNAQETMYDKYSMLIANFDPIDYSLDVYIKYLKKTLEDYKRIDIEISNNIEQVANKLDVNG